jgi:hypothetical protein
MEFIKLFEIKKMEYNLKKCNSDLLYFTTQGKNGISEITIANKTPLLVGDVLLDTNGSEKIENTILEILEERPAKGNYQVPMVFQRGLCNY